MVHVSLSVLIIAVGWSTTLAESVAETSSLSSGVRETRGIRKKLCSKFGLCGGGGDYSGYGGYGGGYGGYGGGYGNPPINIAISQSQSSANEGAGGYGTGYYPNNYQYNGGYPHQGYNGYNRYPNPNYGGYQPGFDNGNYGYNNQFNGNYYSGFPGVGYSPFGYRNGEGGYDYDDYERSASGSVATAGSKTVSDNRS